MQALQTGVRRATETAQGDTTLVVYRANRFCPATSRLPERYGQRIAAVPGVASVTPVKIVVNNCRAALDVVTFRGVPESAVLGEGAGGDGAGGSGTGVLGSRWRFVSGSAEGWRSRGDAAIVGRQLAERRRLAVGQSFDASGVTVNVAGIIDSPEPQDQNVAYVKLDFLQRAADQGGGPGLVTQYTVTVRDPATLEAVAAAIDAEFATEADPTSTKPEKAFIKQAGADMVSLVGFSAWLGWGCLAAVLALVANAIVLSVQDRIKEHAVLATLGFRGGLIARLVVTEGLLLGLAGGVVGAAGAMVFVAAGDFSLSQEGFSINVTADASAAALGLGVSAAVGVVAGLAPAWRAARRPIASCFRAV
ncbi:MAG: ABC transporter permease [Planctomycetaceae bacterium]|nr:ABC transporter permease [Planctomycetaceae bacterium]